MSKLTKREIQLHDQAVCLLQKEHLSHEDKLFIFENFREDAEHINSKSGAFFTPFGLANDFTLQIPCLYGKTIRIIDLCAGIGVLSYAAQLECSDRSRCYADITCVELNPHYVEVGKKVVPEATWICADVLDPFLPDLLGQFDFAIANPPFGRIANNYRKSYMSGEFEYMVIEAASRIAKEGAFYQNTVKHHKETSCHAAWARSSAARSTKNDSCLYCSSAKVTAAPPRESRYWRPFLDFEM